MVGKDHIERCGSMVTGEEDHIDRYASMVTRE